MYKTGWVLNSLESDLSSKDCSRAVKKPKSKDMHIGIYVSVYYFPSICVFLLLAKGKGIYFLWKKFLPGENQPRSWTV